MAKTILSFFSISFDDLATSSVWHPWDENFLWKERNFVSEPQDFIIEDKDDKESYLSVSQDELLIMAGTIDDGVAIGIEVKMTIHDAKALIEHLQNVIKRLETK